MRWNRHPAAFRTLSILALIWTGWVLGVSGLQAQEEEREETPPLVASQAAKPGFYVGVAACANPVCHGSSQPQATYGVLQNEYFHWLRRDPHRRAYEVLFSEESELMARNLRLGEKPYESPLCLGCHALNPPRELQARRLDLEDGVTCESCHGPASGWLEGHRAEGWSHEDSVRAGMIDLRNLEIRARVCLGCHLGDGEREVDHALIASGHPQLLFELDNYTADAQIVHWTLGRERLKAGGPPPTHGARAWAVGQVLAFRESLDQLARRARSERWPEFAEMSCFHCHHSLDEGKWRQLRGYRQRPGQPQWSPARYAMVRHLVATFAPGEGPELERAVREVTRLVSTLRSPDQVAVAAEQAREIVDRVLPRVEEARWREGEIRGLLRRIAGDGPYLREANFQTAEQTFWALNSLVSQWIALDPQALREGLVYQLERLNRELQVPEDYDPDRFSRYLAEMERLGR